MSVMSGKEQNFISAVVYIRNNEKDIRIFLNTLEDVLSGHFDKYEIICVDDDSTDKSVEEIYIVADRREHSNITILHMSSCHGREKCMEAGKELSIGDFVYEFDTVKVDYEAQIIFKIYERAMAGYDIVSASAEGKKRISSSAYYYVFNKFSKSPYALKTETFRILSRRAINRISVMNKTIPYRKAVYANCGLKYESCYYHITGKTDIQAYERKNEKKERKGVAVDSLILFTDVAYKFSIFLTAAMMMVAVFAAVYALFIFMTGSPIEGWTTTILFLAFAFFGLFGILTIVIKYLSILVKLIFTKKEYTFESIERLTK